MKDARSTWARPPDETVGRALLSRPSSPSRPPTRRCSSSAPASSRSRGTTRGSGSGAVAAAAAAARRSGSSSSSSSTDEQNRYETQSAARAAAGTRRQRDREQRENQRGRRPAEGAGPPADRPERPAEGAAIGPRTGQGRRRSREEIQRQLKRLRDQQQQVLRDTDELQRADGAASENRDRMAEARQQVEQSRENVRQASEALEQGQLSQAVTEGHAGRPAAGTTSARSSASDVVEPVRRGDDRDAPPGPATRRGPGAAHRDSSTNGRRTRRRGLRDGGDREQVAAGPRGAAEAARPARRTGCDAPCRRPRRPSRSWPRALYDTVRKADRAEDPRGAPADRAARRRPGVADEAAEASRTRRPGDRADSAKGSSRRPRASSATRPPPCSRAQGELDDLADQVEPRDRPGHRRQPGDPKDNATATAPRPARTRTTRATARPAGAAPGEPKQEPGQPGDRGQSERKGQDGQPGQGSRRRTATRPG